MENNQSIFRKKSLERITSPEQLQDYMRVTNPGVWLILAVVIVLLTGLIVCSAVGRLETTCAAQAVVKDGMMQLVAADPAHPDAVLKEGMEVRVGSEKTRISYVAQAQPDAGTKETGAAAEKPAATAVQETAAATATAETNLPDGTYDAEIVLESITPISFLINS
ncbi:MAG: hypothetical protein IJI10_04080 [Eubacterium sp.]|nr:hypothetical protein [Eubacterium sp.]